MSRKTEEIKLRVTTLEKEWWQEAAAFEGTSLSELIRRVMNERVNRRLPLAWGSVQGVDEKGTPLVTPAPAEPECPVAKLVGVSPARPVEFMGRMPVAPLHAQPYPQANAFDTATVTLNGVEVTPTIVRRTVACACGKPSYVYCRACDV